MGRTRGSSGLLDDDSTEVAEDATAELISVGVEVVEPLAAAVPSLERFGQLSAIEVFEHFGDPGAGPVLVDLLSSEHDTVREWSAWAIAQLGVRDAFPALRAAYQRLRMLKAVGMTFWPVQCNAGQRRGSTPRRVAVRASFK